jgi:ABC-type lipoprotein release transport system permease subunit
MINNTLKMFTGHVQVQKEGYNDDPRLRKSVAGIIPLARKIREELPGARVAARASGFALASSDTRSFGIQVVGVEPAYESGLSTFPGLTREGRFLDDPDAAEIVIGRAMARNLKVGVGGELTLLGSGRDGSFAAGVVTVVGIFDSGSPDMDRSMAEVPLRYFQETFAMGDHGHSVVIAVDSLGAVRLAQQEVQGLVAGREDLVALHWRTLLPWLEQSIQSDFISAWAIYGLLIILVAFSVLNTQLMSVLERTREFGVITALGIKPRKLASLVMLETVLMGLLGLVIGVALGWVLTRYFQVVGVSIAGFEEMAAQFGLPDRIHPAINPISLLLGPVLVFLFSLLAAIYPALRLFRLRPVEAMRAI